MSEATPGSLIPRPRARRLSEEFDVLLAISAGRPMRLQEMMGRMPEHGYTFLLLILALPFCQPLPLPGLSTVFGMIIALIGWRLACRQKPWLPSRVLTAQLSEAVLRSSRRLAATFEVVLKPRWTTLADSRLLHSLYGSVICFSGILLLLPLPIPFSNLLPAVTVVLLAAAIMERDGIFILAGMVAFLGSIAYFVSIFAGSAAAFDLVRDWWF